MRESLLASSSRKGIREEKQKEKAGENERVLKTASFLTRKRGSASRREIPGETGRLYLRLISGGKGRTRRKHRGVPRQRDKPPRFCFVFAGQKIREKPASTVERSNGSNSAHFEVLPGFRHRAKARKSWRIGRPTTRTLFFPFNCPPIAPAVLRASTF